MKPSARLRSSPRARSDNADMRWPTTSISPLVGVSSPPRMCSKVLLPEPDAPTIASVSPRAREKFSSLSTSVRSVPSW
jgi:hypothetical protein